LTEGSGAARSADHVAVSHAGVSRVRLLGRRVDVRGVGIWAELTMPASAVPGRATPVVLVNRMATQGFEWEPALVDGILEAGHPVLTFDHRGVGWSQFGPTDRPVVFQDLVDDARGVVAAFGITRAHLVGCSVGGVIARCVALQTPGLSCSLTYIGSSPGDGKIPVWSPEYTEVAMHPPGPSIEDRVEYLVRELRVMSDARFDERSARARAQRAVDRGWTLDALRHASRAATLVLHGTGDHVLSTDHGRALAAAIPGAELAIVEGMGHDVQPHYAPVILDRLLPLFARTGGA
jgi:pimeloyl-ACP methyl ester carboxylesterase